jgi:hypothetical protein
MESRWEAVMLDGVEESMMASSARDFAQSKRGAESVWLGKHCSVFAPATDAASRIGFGYLCKL